MSQFSDALIQTLKTEIDLARFIMAQGHSLKPHGKDKVMTCPFHDDKTPSLVISPETNLWHCLGACDMGGSVIDWVMKTEKKSFRHAVEALSERFGFKDHPTPLTSAATPQDDVDDAQQLQQVMDYYHETLKASPEALAYLQDRGLTDPELISHCQLGYANRTLGYRLPSKGTQEGKAIRAQLQRIGILRDSGHEHFNGSLVVPILSPAGAITELYGRKITRDTKLRKGTPLHTYLPGPHQGVWNEAALSSSRDVILCESLIDAMTFWCAGLRHVTASYGTGGFTADHLAAFKRAQIQRVFIAYDRDEAGDRGAETLAKRLVAEGMTCYRVLFPKGMDANEYARKLTPAEKSLGLALREAQWLGGSEPMASESAQAITTESTQPIQLTQPHTTATPTILAAPTTNDVATCQVNDQDWVLTIEDRQYRVRGLARNTHMEQLKVNLMVRYGGRFHVDQLDLYAARYRMAYLKQAAVELGVDESLLKQDMGKVLLQLEALQDEQYQQAQLHPDPVKMSEAEVKEAMALLKTPNLLDTLAQDFDRLGMVGERTNKLVGYLAGVSRKMTKPLAILIQSTSAAGKTALMDAILAMMPAEDRVQYSAMTGQSVYYMGEHDLRHKILAIAEEEGAQQTSYALKLLQSEGKVTMASVGKNPTTGQLETHDYEVEGPVALFYTTTAMDIDEELRNRCLVLSVDESRDQTRAIHQQQRHQHTLAGFLQQDAGQGAIRRHQNAQRLLRPLKVFNPYAPYMTFLDEHTRTRRDHTKYLSLIDTIALLHQYQRPILTVENTAGETVEYIEVTLDDIAAANVLAHEVLGRTLDELPPQTRRLLTLIESMKTQACADSSEPPSDYRFTRKALRDQSGWSHTQLKVHLDRLVEMEYLLVHGGCRGKSYVYEVLYQGEGQDGTAFLLGLIDPAQLARHRPPTTASLRGEMTQFAGPTRPQNAPNTGGLRPTKNANGSSMIESNAILPTTTAKCTTAHPRKTAHHNRESA